uniref:Uncharacterized protein n=1 Tax=Arundo donax TaxID=35708 RepID=A0A0A9GA13_ARUDO
MEGEDKGGILAEASCSSTQGIKLLIIFLLSVPLHIICCTKELLNSPPPIILEHKTRWVCAAAELVARIQRPSCKFSYAISGQSLGSAGSFACPPPPPLFLEMGSV